MFGESLRNARESKELSLDALAQLVAEILGEKLSGQSIQKWETGASVPRRDKWAAIEKALGQPDGWVFALISADTRQHVASSISMRDATRSPAINAQNVGSIQISADDNLSNGQQPNGHYELLSDIEYEVLTLFRKYGNPTLLQRCLGQLRQAEELFG